MKQDKNTVDVFGGSYDHDYDQDYSGGFLFTTSKTDRHLLRQKVRQRISVMKTNTGVFVFFKTKRQSKCQFSGITEIL